MLWHLQKTSVYGGSERPQVRVPDKELKGGSAEGFLAEAVKPPKARYSTGWITSGLPVIQEESITS